MDESESSVASPERQQKKNNLYSILLGQDFKGTPAESGMPDEFVAPDEFTQVFISIFANPDNRDQEFSAIVGAGKNGKLVSSPILRGEGRSVRGYTREFNKILLQLRKLRQGQFKELISGGPDILIHSHPLGETGTVDPRNVAAHPEEAANSWGDFLGIMSRADSQAILDTSYNPQVRESQTRVSLYLKGKDVQLSGALPFQNPNKRKWGEPLEELISYRRSLAGILKANGIRYYEALIDQEAKRTRKLKFSTVPADDLHELGPFVKSQDIGLFLPSGMAETGSVLTASFRRSSPLPEWGTHELPAIVKTRLRNHQRISPVIRSAVQKV